MRAALRDDLESQLGVPLAEWIEERAQGLASYGRVGHDRVELTKKLLRARNISAIRERKLEVLGRILFEKENYVIEVMPYLDKAMWRYTVAHEIGHTFWFADLHGTRPKSLMQGSIGTNEDIELLCDWFAAALLIPRDGIERRLSNLLRDKNELVSVLLTELSDLSTWYCVPERVLARRVIDLTSVSYGVACIKKKKVASKLEPEWHLSWSVAPSRHDDLSAPTERRDRRYRPRIPAGMFPDWASDQVTMGEVDGRWLSAMIRPPHAVRAQGLRYALPGGSANGFALTKADRAYIAVKF